MAMGRGFGGGWGCDVYLVVFQGFAGVGIACSCSSLFLTFLCFHFHVLTVLSYSPYSTLYLYAYVLLHSTI